MTQLSDLQCLEIPYTSVSAKDRYKVRTREMAAFMLSPYSTVNIQSCHDFGKTELSTALQNLFLQGVVQVDN